MSDSDSQATRQTDLGQPELLKCNPQGALDLNQKALAVRRERVRQQPANASYQRQLAIDLVRVADALGSPGQPNLGRYAEARKIYEESMSIREALRKAAPGSVNAARDVCNLLQRQGRLLNQLGEFEKSLATSNAADSILASFWKADLANFEIRRDMANLQSQIADSHDLMGNYALAENAGRKRLAICAELHRKNPTSDRSQEDLSSARKGMGLWLSSRGRNREAREHLRSALAEFKDLMRRNPDAGFYERKMVRLVGGLADVYQKLGEPVSACATYRDALALANRLQAGTRLRIDDQSEPDRFRKALASCP